MNKVQLSELLDKYLDGTCSPEEAAAINHWYEQSQGEPEYTESLTADKRSLLKAKIFESIASQTNISSKTATISAMNGKWWLGIAAAALLLVAFKFFILNNTHQQTRPQSLSFSITNHSKNVLRQLLPDSSVVWLSPEASLSWPKKFAVKSRNVAMAGSCFFEVTKNPNRPFIITSEHIVTKVWGTSFRVLDGKDIKNAKVTVVSGKVSVSKKGEAVQAKLTAGEVLLYPKEEAVLTDNDTQLITNRQANLSDLKLYDHIDLSFEKAKLTEIVAVLNRKFDTNIKISNKELDNSVMTADLTNLNLPEVLEVLKAAMKLNYEISGDLIILKQTN